jgi:hypothetical protein
MPVYVNTRESDRDSEQIRVYVKDKKRLDRIAEHVYDLTGRRPSYAMLVKSLLDGKEDTP